jgi:hypothetical protein
MDTPQNRTAMPKVNYDAWLKVEEVAATILFLSASADEVASAQSERSTRKLLDRLAKGGAQPESEGRDCDGA